ncbi:5-oxoprolinase subunit PxpC [Bacillus carboniphilus]|uniref:5-oxoprolinase subunit PxpC n=1 Tax=Bacillus carboniphilus TaxID=86663 RepID=A0ABP3FZ79_9BACI
MGIRILKEGFYTTIQDLGRFSYKDIGIPSAGAMDLVSATLANWVALNHETAPVLECTLMGPTLHFDEDALVVVGGKGFIPKVNQTTYQLFQPIWVHAGEQLQLISTEAACRCYIAIHGGIILNKVLGSFSTYTRGKIGGLNGMPIQKGDMLPTLPTHLPPKKRWYLSPELYTSLYNQRTIRFLKGNQADWFSEDMFQQFQKNSYKISSQSDRMGYRLEGLPLEILNKKELTTEGTVPGTVQIPPNGQPIILMRDSQVTGGYPKIGTVISWDVSVLGQKRPGDSIHFKEVSLDEAYEIRKNIKNQLHKIKRRIELER